MKMKLKFYHGSLMLFALLATYVTLVKSNFAANSWGSLFKELPELLKQI